MSLRRQATCGVLSLVIIGIVLFENATVTNGPVPTATATDPLAKPPLPTSAEDDAFRRLNQSRPTSNSTTVHTVVDERTAVGPSVSHRPAVIDESRPTTSATRGSPEDDKLRRLDANATTTCFLLGTDERKVYDIVVRRFANTTATDLPKGMRLAPANRPAPPLRPGAVSPVIPRVMMQTNKHRYVKLGMRVAMESWLRRNPDYGYEYYSDDTARQYISAHYSPVYMTVFNLIRPGAFKADFFRMMWLHQQGGVYVDVDSYAGAPLSEAICPSDNFFGPVTLPHRVAPYTIFQAFIGATAGHPVLKLVLDSGVRYVMQRSYYGTQFNGAGGPASVYRALAMYLNKTEIVFGHLPEQSMSILVVSYESAACHRISVKAHTPNVSWCPAMPRKGSLNRATESQEFSHTFWHENYGFTRKTHVEKKIVLKSGKESDYHNTTESYSSAFRFRKIYNTSIPERFDADIPAIQFSDDDTGDVVAEKPFRALFDGNLSSVVPIPSNGTLFRLSGPPGGRIQCVLAFESRRAVDFLYGSLSLVARGASSDGEAEDVVERVIVSRNDGTRVHRLPLGGALLLGKLKRGATVQLSGTFVLDRVVLSALLFFDSPDCSGRALRVGGLRREEREQQEGGGGGGGGKPKNHKEGRKK